MPRTAKPSAQGEELPAGWLIAQPPLLFVVDEVSVVPLEVPLAVPLEVPLEVPLAEPLAVLLPLVVPPAPLVPAAPLEAPLPPVFGVVKVQ